MQEKDLRLHWAVDDLETAKSRLKGFTRLADTTPEIRARVMGAYDKLLSLIEELGTIAEDFDPTIR